MMETRFFMYRYIYIIVILVTGDGYEMDYISWGKKVKGGFFVIILEEMVGMDGSKVLPM